MFFSSDKSKLVIALSCTMLAAFIFIAAVNYQVSRRFIREELINSSLPLLRDTIYSEIHADLMQPIHVSSVMANDTFLRDWALHGEQDVSQVIKYLNGIHERYGFFSAFFVSSATGNYYHYKDVLKKITPTAKHDGWYYSFMDSGLAVQLDVDTDEASNNELTIFINCRMNDYAGKAIGVTGVGLRLSTLANIFANYKRMNGRIVYLVDRRGEVQVHSEMSLVKNGTLASLASPDIAEKVLGIRNYPMDYEYEGEDGTVYLTARYIPEIDWFLVVQQPENVAMVSVRDNLVRTFGAGFLMMCAVLGITLMALNRYQSKLEMQAVTDTLTGLANRRGLEQRFALLHSMYKRGGSDFTLAVLDLDGFKQVNDIYGHGVGDQLLQAIGALAMATFRETDVVARWGGDEFMLLVMGNADVAAEVIKRFRDALLKTPLASVAGKDIFVGVSCGLTTVLPADTLDSAYLRADGAMYEAKQGMSDGCKVEEV